MKMMMEDEEFDRDQSSDEDVLDSDEELQEAFARGDLKPGLVVLQNSTETPKDKKLVINNIPVLEYKLSQIKLPKKLGWAERLDIVNGVAPLAPEIALQMDEHKTKREREIKFSNVQKKKKSGAKSPSVKQKLVDEDPVHNDFVREMNFYRQGQEAILKCLPRLKELGVPTRRPDDYFAEMAKSDGHMQKVAKVLHKKQIATERSEKVRKIRQQKKFAKQTQVAVLQERQKAKKELMENVKKYRKGQKNSLDFLDDNKKGRGGGQKNSRGDRGKSTVNRRREMKDDKYGSGAKMKGSKWNTRESLDDYEGAGKGNKRGSRGGRGGGRMGAGGRGGGGRGGRGGFSRGRGSSSGGRGGFSGGRGGFSGGRGGSSGGRGGFSGGRGGGSKRPGKMTRQQNKARSN